MSDLPPADQPQDTPARRATRPKSRSSSAARRARLRKPTTPDIALSAEAFPDAEEMTLAETTQDEDESPTGDFTPTSSEAEAETQSEEETSQKQRGLTPISKKILLWGAITGGIYVLFFAGLSLLSLAPTQVLQIGVIAWPLTCLVYLLPYALPFVAGWRATAREGLGRHGALAGLWSLILYIIVLEFIEVVIRAFHGTLAGPKDGDVVQFIESFVFQALISLALGWIGGSYSSWQRRRAAQRQAKEAEVAAPPA